MKRIRSLLAICLAAFAVSAAALEQNSETFTTYSQVKLDTPASTLSSAKAQ